MTRHPDPAVRAEMRRIRAARPAYGWDAARREEARRRPTGIDWAGFRRSALHAVIAYTLAADLALILGAVRDAQPHQMRFPAASVTTTALPHPATPPSRP